MEQGFLCRSSENFRNIWKGSSDFPDELFLREIRVPFLQSYLCIRPSQPFFGKWNWFVQIVNAIPEWCPKLLLPFAQVVNNLLLKTVVSRQLSTLT